MPLNRTTVDLDILVQSALDSLGALTTKVSIRRQKGPVPVMVNCDAMLVTRVIANLVGNAIKFAPEGGPVTITVEEKGTGAKVRVVDTGRGIPREYHAKIFEKFWQVEARQHRNCPSTGLGLTFCKLAVEAHGGVIGVESEVDKGSTFWFTLP